MKNVCDDQCRKQCAIIGMTGDKGQAASLLGKPAILFDDKEDNVLQVLQADTRNEGCVVRIGSRATHRVKNYDSERFHVSSNPSEWFDMSKRFHETIDRTRPGAFFRHAALVSGG